MLNKDQLSEANATGSSEDGGRLCVCLHLQFVHQLLLLPDQCQVLLLVRSHLTEAWMSLHQLEVDHRATLNTHTHTGKQQWLADYYISICILEGKAVLFVQHVIPRRNSVFFMKFRPNLKDKSDLNIIDTNMKSCSAMLK